MDNSDRVERLLRELHAGPPLRFLEDAFSLTEFAAGKIAAIQETVMKGAAGHDDDQALA